jgi:hypothetical protein
MQLIYFNTTNNIDYDNQLLLIPEFKLLYNQDSSKNKNEFQNILTYIYNLCDANSTYSNIYPYEERKRIINRDYINRFTIVEDEFILDAIIKYNLLTKTPIQKLYDSLQSKINEMSNFYDTLPVNIETIKIISGAIKEIGTQIISMDNVKIAASKGKVEKINIRGGGENRLYED